MYCLNAETGAVVWTTKISDYLQQLGATLPGARAAARPVVHQDTVIIGTMQAVYGGYAYWLALRVSDGGLVWGRLADTHIAAIVTLSPTLHEGVLYTGLSSLEENVASRAAYVCCDFRGSVVALDASTGAVKWQTFTTPTAPAGTNQTDWWSGAAVWGSAPVVDRQRGQVIISTGDNYEMPDEVEDCLVALGNLTAANAPQQKACLQLAGGKDNHHNAIIALDMQTGAIKWSNPVDGPDAWNAACLSSNPLVNDNCPNIEGPDFDFGQAPMLVTTCKQGKGCKQLLVVGQKSGIVWAMDPADGRTIWNQRAGPGGLIGGLMWGSASDNKLIYVNNNNMGNIMLDFAGADAYLKPVPNALNATAPPTSANGGLCVALDAWDGAVVWSFPNPTRDQGGRNAKSLSPITVANGVVAYASMDPAGSLFMLKAADGKLLGSYGLGASSACGPAIVGGIVYSGSGYSNFALGADGTKVTALTI
ncbi:MAG: quinon protein alcohol dehydrogenase-like superfamily [Monoraphidium minutum]|nr:MAG: quinon protein alcohol dehydrogenase-like superfamily [Monoraphidium minutum]